MGHGNFLKECHKHVDRAVCILLIFQNPQFYLVATIDLAMGRVFKIGNNIDG